LVVDDERHDFYLFAAWQSFLMEWLLMRERSNFRTAKLHLGHLEGIRLPSWSSLVQGSHISATIARLAFLKVNRCCEMTEPIFVVGLQDKIEMIWIRQKASRWFLFLRSTHLTYRPFLDARFWARI
jgi:hypothetical protein